MNIFMPRSINDHIIYSDVLGAEMEIITTQDYESSAYKLELFEIFHNLSLNLCRGFFYFKCFYTTV